MKSGRTTAYLREINQKTVLNIIRKQPVSRSDIARKTSLTKPAVSAIVENLISQGYIEEIGQNDIARGRHPELLSIKSGTYYAVGVDISRTGYSAGVCDLTGKMITSFDIDAHNLPPILVVKKISAEIKQNLSKHKIAPSKLLGIGVNVPGPVDTLTGEILNPPNFLNWNNFNVAEHFINEFNLPVSVENDSTSYALAENLYGQGLKFKNYFMMVLVDGVGSSLILDGRPYRGLRGLNPEIGHVSIDINGEQCECGNRGCLELYTSIPRILKKAADLGLKAESWEQIVDNALSQNQEYLDLIRSEARYLAFAVGNVINIFRPEAVIFSGKIQYKSDLLLTLIKNEVYSQGLSKGISVPRILMSSFEGNRSILAACSIVLSNFFYP